MILARIRAALRATLVLRVCVVVLAAGLAFMLVVRGRVARAWEAARQRERVASLLAVVQSSAGAACFAEDPVLAKQVVTGLLGSRDVRSARILSNDRVLAEASRPGRTPGPAVGTPLASPYDDGSILGTLLVEPDLDEAELQGARTASLFRKVFAAALLGVSGILAFYIRTLILDPLGGIREAIGGLDPGAPRRIPVPKGHDRDELGRLVAEVDALVERFTSQRWREAGAPRTGDPPTEDVGVAVVRAGGTLEAWTPAFTRVLGLAAAPQPGMGLAFLLGDSARALEAGLAGCPPEGATLHLKRGRDRVRMHLEPAGTGWFRIAVVRERRGARAGRQRPSGGPSPPRWSLRGFPPRRPRP